MSSVTHFDSRNLNTVPEHHLHSEGDPLPGVKGTIPAADHLTDGETRSGQQYNGSNSTELSNNTNTSFDAEQPVDDQPTSGEQSL